jgi:uncharacterized repeat protein (TIGR01451 family)/fimbrial isopeptide formation D2 family protein
LTAAVLLGVGALPMAAQAATGTPAIALSAGGSSSALYGSPATVSLTASNPTGQPTGYNLTMEDVLPAGVSYVANSSSFSGQDIEPQVLTGEPSAGKTTLIWSNLSDLSPNSQAKLTYQVQASTSTFSVGSSYTEQQSAYVNTNPRTVPSFTGTGAPVSSSYTGSATASGSTTLSALQVTTSDAAGAKLLRGVHDHQTVYTMTVTNNGVKPTSGTALDAYLPAGLEFLGCDTADNTTSAATNPGSTEEWPGSGALSGRTANPGNCSGYSEVQTGNFTPGNGIPSGFYTHVQYDPGTLASGTSVTYKFVAGVPIRENTDTWTGAKPSDASGGQAANLDNNSGEETYDGESLPTYALATGSYNGTTAVAATSTDTSTAEDDIITKSADSPNITIGSVDTWTLNIAVGEYRYVQDLQVTDTMPDGTCPAGGSGDGAPADCAAVPQSPSSPYTTIAENSDGSWTETWDESTDPTLAELGPDATTQITIPVLVRSHYQSGGSDTTPVVAGDSWSGSATLLSTDYVRCGAPANPDCSGGGTMIDHDFAEGDSTDSSAAGQSSAQPAISKLIDGRTVTPVSCATDNYVSTTPNYSTGDTVCYKLHVAFPAGVYTGGAAITDFLPPGTTYNAGSWQTTGSNTATVGTVDSTTNPGVLSIPLGSGGYANPGDVLDAVYSVTITNPAAANQYDIKGNLMKFASVNTAGQSFPQRAAANYEFSKPLLGLTEGVYKVNGAPSSGDGAGTTDVSVEGGDTVTMRVDVKNTGGLDAVDTDVWEDMPSQLSCSNFSNVAATSSTCVSGSPSTVEWTGVPVPAGQTVTLYYTYTVPSGSYATQNLTSDAGVVDYQNATDNGPGTTFTNIPTSNIDPNVSTLVGTPNTQAANGSAYTYIASPGIGTTDTTSVASETGNNSSQASIGETITYTSTVTIPAGANEGTDGRFSGSTNDTNTTFVPGSLTATLNGAALPSGWTMGEYDLSGYAQAYVYPPSDYTPATAQTLVVTWSETVNDASVNYAGQSPTDWSYWYYDYGATGTYTVLSSSAGNTIVEPKLSATLTSNASGRVSPGQVLTYTAKLSDSNAANVSSANNTAAVATVPVGETPVNAGTPVADGGTVGGGGNGVWSQSARTVTFPSTGQILPGASASYAYTVTVDNPQPSSTQLMNTLAATTTSLLNAPTTPGTARTAASAAALSPPVSGYAASANNTVTLIDATVSKSVSAPNATIGDPETYTVNVSIPAGVNLNDAMVRDIVPDGVSYDDLMSATCTSGCGTPSDIPVSEIPHQSNAGGTTTLGFWLGEVPSSSNARTLALTYDAHVLSTYHTGSKVLAGQTLNNSATIDDNPSQTFSSEPASIPATSSFGYISAASVAAITVTEPNVTIAKTVADTDSTAPNIGLGDNLTYTLAVKNTGTGTAYDVPVSDTPGAGIAVGTYGSGSSDLQQSWTPGGSSTWAIPSIGAGQTVNLTYTATLADSSELHNNQTIANNALVGTYYGASDGERTAHSSWTYRTYTGSSTSATITAELPELTVSNTTGASGFPKTSGAQVGQQFNWRPTVINNTIATAYNATLTYQLPANWSYVPGSAGGYGDPSISAAGATQTLTWNVGTMNPGSIDPVAFKATPSVVAETTPGSGAAHLNSTTENVAWSDVDSNSASADGDYIAGPDSADAQLNIPVLTITKTPNAGSWTAGATNQDWTIEVSNTGAAPATDVTVTDDIPAGNAYAQGAATDPSAGFSEMSYDNSGATTNVTWTIASLAAGASTTITVPSTPAANTPNGTVLNNTASAQANEVPTPVTDSGSATVSTSADLGVSVSAPATVNAGSELDYTIATLNNGSSDGTGVTFTDPLPAGTAFRSITAPSGWNCTTPAVGQAGAVTCSHSAGYATGASDTFELTVGTDPNLPAGTVVADSASITGEDADPNAANNSASASTTVAVAADMAVTDTVSGGSSQQRQATYTLTYTNNGPSTSHDATVTDTLPSGVNIDSVDDPNCTTQSGVVTCSEGTMTVGQTGTVHIAVTATDVGGQDDAATVSADEPDPNPANNAAAAGLTVGPTANLTLTKTASEPTVVADGTVAYTLTVVNHGPSAAHDVAVTDPMPAGLQPLDASVEDGGSCQTSGQTVTCTLAELDNGASATETLHARAGFALAGTTVINTATASASEDDTGQLSERTGTASVTVGPAADLSVSTTAPASTPAASNLTYALAVSNSGPQAATGATVTDTLPAGGTLVSAQPSEGSCAASGPTVTCQLGTVPAGAGAQVLVTVAVPLAGQGSTLTDGAQVSAAEPDPVSSNNQSQAASAVVAPLVTPGHLAVTVRANTPQVTFGNDVAYIIAVTNDSAAAATDVKQLITLGSPVQVISVSTPDGRCKGLTCSLGTVKPGQTVYIHLVVRPETPGEVPVSTVANSDQGASHPAHAKALTTVKARTRLVVSKRAQRPTVEAGDTMTYTLAVRNAGRHAAANVVVCDRANLNMTYERTRGARFRQGEPCWTDPMLRAGHRFQVTLTVRFVDSASGAQTSSASASAKNAPLTRGKATVKVLSEDSVNGLEGVTG